MWGQSAEGSVPWLMKERTSFAPRLGPYYKQNPNKSTHSIIPSSIRYSRPPPIILASTTPYCPRLLQHRHYSLFIFTRSTTLPEIISTTMIFTSLPFTSLYDTFPARCVCVYPFSFQKPRLSNYDPSFILWQWPLPFRPPARTHPGTI